MFSASVDLSGFREQVERSRRAVKLGIARGVGKAAAEGAAEAKSVGRYRDRTGRLRSGIVARFLSDDGSSVAWEILSPAKYSKFIEYGTRPHVIRAKAGGFLRFVVGGRTVFAKQVNHPGTQPYPFGGPGLLKAERVLYREFDLMQAQLEQIWR